MLDYVQKSQLANKEKCLIMKTLNELKAHMHIYQRRIFVCGIGHSVDSCITQMS